MRPVIIFSFSVTDIFELEMATYINESLDKLHKKDLIPIVLFLQNKLYEASNLKTELLNEIRKLNNKFDKLQSDVCISKNVKGLLLSRLVVLTLNVNAGQMPSILRANA